VEDSINMATFQASTASNAPAVDPDRVGELQKSLDEWFLGMGNFDDITASVQVPGSSPDTDDERPPYLSLHGYASFAPVHRPDVRNDVREILGEELDELDSDEREAVLDDKTEQRCWEHAGEHTEDFLRELSAFLTEPFVVQTVGFEKCRFPLVSYQYSVDLEGETDHVQLG
jgi:hypothetical protein